MAGYGGPGRGRCRRTSRLWTCRPWTRILPTCLTTSTQPREGPNGLELTPAQKAGLQDYVTGLGYQGLRHEPEMIGRQGGPADEVVIYDVNAANRVVGSEAEAVPPNQPGKSAAEQFVETTADAGNMLDRVLPAEVVNAVKQNESTASADEEDEGAGGDAIQAKNDKKYQANMLNFGSCAWFRHRANIGQFTLCQSWPHREPGGRCCWAARLGCHYPLSIFGGAVDATRLAATRRLPRQRLLRKPPA